jgi:hypothetical protein
MSGGGDEAEHLRHNPRNAVTRSVERVRRADGSSFVRKVLQAHDPDALDFWQASPDPRHWNSWRREVEAYRSEALRSSLLGTGLGLADAAVHESPSGDEVTLELEDVAGTPGASFTLEQHAALARAVGRWQARPPLDLPWLSQGFLREYSGSKPFLVDVARDDERWAHPLVAAWPAGVRAGWERMVANRSRLLQVMEALPRVTAHLDLWVSNEIRRPSGEVVLLDWAFSGDGAVGEDLGNHVPDGVFDLFWPAERVHELDEAVFAAHLEGLREGGSTVDERIVRLGVVGASVKYVWLLPLLLADVDRDQHAAYHEATDTEHLYQQRGLGLAFLFAWCDEALRLADELGLG